MAGRAVPVQAAYKGIVSKADESYNDATLSKLQHCTWTYNYLTAPTGSASGIDFIPMVFGHFNFKSNGDLQGSDYQNLQDYGAKSKHIIGFNEPDGDAADQAKIGVDLAVAYWYKVSMDFSVL